MGFWWRVALAMLLGVAGCNRAADQAVPGPSGAEAPAMAVTLEVTVTEGVVRLALHATNTTTEPIRLEFPSAQRYDFAIRTVAGEGIWQWSADRMFAQVLGTETVPAGGTLSYREEWRPGGRKGEFEAVGWLTAEGQRLEQRARFEL